MKRIIHIKTVIPVFIAALFLSGCATSIAGIKSLPEKYAGADVIINASVELEAQIPFMDYSLYRVADETGKMFLFTDKKYRIGEKLFISAHVIGITEKNSKNAAEQIARKTADFLVENKIAEPSKALKLSRKLIRLISTLGSMAEGSYFLIAK